MVNSGSLNAAWSRLLIEELRRHDVSHFCIAPGSRSTPLTLAVANNSKLDTTVHFDERGLAYFALGHARATGRPVAVITTSGTAVANLYPAVVEASMDEVPLILLTADRPPELRQTSANQTIDQVHLFGSYLRWQFDLPCPDPAIKPEMLLTCAAQAAALSCHPSPGPVQLNCMFREPLMAPAGDIGQFDSAHRDNEEAYTFKPKPLLVSQDEDVERVAERLRRSKRGLLVVGSLRHETERQTVEQFASKLKWPMLAEVTSGLRFSRSPELVPYFDLILASERFSQSHPPDMVLHLGGRITSKRLQQFLESSRPASYVQINQSFNRHDPGHLVSEHMRCDLSRFLRSVLTENPIPAALDYLSAWHRATQQAGKLLDDKFDNTEALSEPAVARMLSRMLPSTGGLFLASSMPIRAMDMYADTGLGPYPVAANRGASGIDGTVATAAGLAAGLAGRVICLVGDLAMLHDLNSLALLRDSDQPIVVIVLNNNGGGIFNQLPVAQLGETFKRYFVTPQNVTFEPAAAMFSLNYRSVSTALELRAACELFLGQSASMLIEVKLDATSDYRLHSEIVRQVAASVDQNK